MRLLIVDDDQGQIQRWGDTIDQFSHAHKIEIRPEYRNNVEEGLNAALSQDYDGAVIDLRLSPDNDAEGNLIIREIKKNKRFPICVLTGYPQDLDHDLQEHAEDGPNLFFWVERRDRPFAEVLTRLLTVYQSGVVEILGPHGIIDKALHTIFWTHLAKTLSFWNSQPESDLSRRQRLLRFILALLLSKLEANDEGILHNAYPDEMYVIPPFRTDWQTGDIVRRNKSDTFFVILTPSCDLAQGKAKRIQVVEVESFQSGIMLDKLNVYKKVSTKVEAEASDEPKTVANKQDQAKALEELLKLAGNAYSNRYHFLPRCQSFPGGILNFQKVESIQLKEFSNDHQKQGTITSDFLKDIVARFAAYYARQGQPDFDCKRMINDLLI